jgi:Transmembrane protein 43
MNAIKLKRTVEMFQWVEHIEKGKRGEKGRVTYTKEYKETVINSGEFREPGHMNPPSMPFESKEQIAPVVNYGGFILADS